MCFKCNKPGHFIQFCPATEEELRANVQRRAPVGIPRTQLRTVASADAAEGSTQTGFAMPDGSIAKMVADTDTFNKARDAAKQGERERAVEAEVPAELRCPVSRSLLRNAVLLPCCGASVSDDAIGTALVEGTVAEWEATDAAAGATCTLCGTQGVRVDEVIPNRQLRAAVAAYLDDLKGSGRAAAAAAAAGSTR